MSMGLEEAMAHPELGASNRDQSQALRDILNLGGVALATGVGVRGMAGLGNFFGRNTGGAPKTPLRQSFVRIPVPVRVKTPEERDAMLAAAGQDKDAGFAKLADWADTFGDAVGLIRRPGDRPNWAQDMFGGWGQHSPMKMPWAWPAAGAAIVGGGIGGWKLTDYLLDKTKNMEQESELEEARKDYEGALAGRRKLAAAVETSPLDVLADLYEKRGNMFPELTGAALLGGLGIAGLSGLGTYNWTRSIAEDKAVEEAVRRRQAQIAEQSPSPIMALPTPVPVYDPQPSHWDRLTGRGGKKEEKVANVGQAADQFLNRTKQNQMAVWNRLMTPTDGKPAKPAKPEPPPPPKLPSLAGSFPQGAPAGAADTR